MVETQKLSRETESSREEVLSSGSWVMTTFVYASPLYFPISSVILWDVLLSSSDWSTGWKVGAVFIRGLGNVTDGLQSPLFPLSPWLKAKESQDRKSPDSWLEMSCPPRFSGLPWTMIEARYTFIELISEVWIYLLLQQNLNYPDGKHLPRSAINSFYPATSHNLSSLQASS